MATIHFQLDAAIEQITMRHLRLRLGQDCSAIGMYSVAIGNNCDASNAYSFALGNGASTRETSSGGDISENRLIFALAAGGGQYNGDRWTVERFGPQALGSFGNTVEWSRCDTNRWCGCLGRHQCHLYHLRIGYGVMVQDTVISLIQHLSNHYF